MFNDGDDVCFISNSNFLRGVVVGFEKNLILIQHDDVYPYINKIHQINIIKSDEYCLLVDDLVDGKIYIERGFKSIPNFKAQDISKTQNGNWGWITKMKYKNRVCFSFVTPIILNTNGDVK